MKRFPLVALFSFAVCFVGCDNSSSTDAEKTSDVREVETIYNLGKCSDSHKGELAFVIDDEREYICFGGKWIPSEEVENKLELSSKSSSSSKQEELSSGSETKDESSSSEQKKTEEKSSCSALITNAESSSSIASSGSVETEPVSSSSVEPSEETSSSVEKISLSSASNLESSDFTDPRDQKVYKLVKIGEQVWFAQNMNYFGEDAPGSCHENDSDNCAVYGRLYTWKDALKACPPGSHLPNLAEWLILFKNIGGLDSAGVKLKSKDGWTTQEDFVYAEGRDEYGFSVLPAGFMVNSSRYGSLKIDAYLWTATELLSGSESANMIFFMYCMEKAVIDDFSKTSGISVRCLKD